MKRRRFTVARIGCLLLCVLIVALWIRSYRTSDEWLLIYRTDGCERVSTLNGDVMIRHERPQNGKSGGFQRISHRSDRVGALPPRPWREDLLQTRWRIFRYINTAAPPARFLASPRLPTVTRRLPVPAPRPLTASELQSLGMLALATTRPLTPLELQSLRGLALPTTRPLTPSELQLVRGRLLAATRPFSPSQSQLLQRQAALRAATSVQPAYYGDSFWELVFPMWLLPTALVLPFVLTWLAGAIRRQRRRRRGLCPSCGYDLRATPGNCPECGAVPAQA